MRNFLQKELNENELSWTIYKNIFQIQLVNANGRRDSRPTGRATIPSERSERMTTVGEARNEMIALAKNQPAGSLILLHNFYMGGECPWVLSMRGHLGWLGSVSH